MAKNSFIQHKKLCNCFENIVAADAADAATDDDDGGCGGNEEYEEI